MALVFSLFLPRIHRGPLIRRSWTSIFERKFASAAEPSTSIVNAAPPPPKRKVSNSFGVFLQENCKEFSNTDPKKILKLASEKWHSLNEYQKNDYVKKAQQNKKENIDLIRQYEAQYSAEQREKYRFLELQGKILKNEKTAKRKAGLPNLKISGYNIFTQEFAKTFDYSGKKGLEYLIALSSAVSKSWKNLSASEKEAFTKRAEVVRRGEKH